jgi:peptide/nickel transport system permease protein
VLAALRHNTWVDQTAMTFALIGVSVPNFWLGLLMILSCSPCISAGCRPGGYVPILPISGAGCAALTLPAVSLALLQIGLLARITRSTMLEVLRQDYIRTARAKGLPRIHGGGQACAGQRRDPGRHRGRHLLGLLLSGSIIVETVFSDPGHGRAAGQWRSCAATTR